MVRLPNHLAGQTRNLVIITGVITTLFIWTSLTDPINLPKMFILGILAAWILGYVGVGIVSTRKVKMSLGLWASIAFILGVLIAALSSDVTYTAFFGAAQRNDGAISYIALSILSAAAMMTFGHTNLGRLRIGLLGMGALLSVYGLLQTFGHDPIKWKLVYSPVMGTLGNPDFFSALTGTLALATTWYIISEKKRWSQSLGLVLLLTELFIVKRSGSFQGLVAFSFGLTILLIAKIWQINRNYGIASCILAGVGTIPVFAGLFNKGPLAVHIYRSSLRNRIDYWHAALSMFKAHPVLGVGLDRLGDNYGRYAPQIQTVQGQGTDNAHNVFLQLMATGGLVVIVPYLLLITVIIIAAVRAIRKTTGEVQFDLIALFAFWAALLLISIISIDNLGVAIWFWISGGVLYAVSHEQSSVQTMPLVAKRKSARIREVSISENSGYIAPIISLVLTIFILIVMAPIWRTSSALLDLQSNKYGLDRAQYIARLDQVANLRPKNVQTLISVADLSLRISSPDQAIKFAKQALKYDPRSLNAHSLTAIAYESSKHYLDAIPFRSTLLKLDPWNTKNMLQLVADYVQVKDLPNARAIATRLATFYPNNSDAVAAAALIKG